MESIKLIECPRDAWQGLPRQIPTERKAEYLRGLVAAGFRHIDAVSFVSPKAVPQMADSEKVLEQLGPLEDVEIIGIVVNERGAERAIATGAVSTLGYPCSISKTFLRRNQNQSPEQNEELLKKIRKQADEAGLAMVAYISMAFGNPYGDPWSEDKVAQAAETIAGLGIRSVSIADPGGAADPALAHRVVAAVVRAWPECPRGRHMHPPRRAITNVGLLFVACLHFGAQFFELLRRGFFISAFFRASENGKNSIAGLRRTHHGVACVWPSKDKTRVISLAAERVIPGTKRATDHDRDFRHD